MPQRPDGERGRRAVGLRSGFALPAPHSARGGHCQLQRPPTAGIATGDCLHFAPPPAFRLLRCLQGRVEETQHGRGVAPKSLFVRFARFLVGNLVHRPESPVAAILGPIGSLVTHSPHNLEVAGRRSGPDGQAPFHAPGSLLGPFALLPASGQPPGRTEDRPQLRKVTLPDRRYRRAAAPVCHPQPQARGRPAHPAQHVSPRARRGYAPASRIAAADRSRR